MFWQNSLLPIFAETESASEGTSFKTEKQIPRQSSGFDQDGLNCSLGSSEYAPECSQLWIKDLEWDLKSNMVWSRLDKI